MYLETQQQMQSAKYSSPKTNQLTAFDRWWASLLPSAIKAIMPHWSISSGILTLMALLSKSPLLITISALVWASIFFTFVLRKLVNLSVYIEKQKWIVAVYYSILGASIAKPVMAQETTVGAVAACNTSGLFGTIGTFVTNIFAAVTFGSVGGATLSNLICQVISYMTLAILLAFLTVSAYVSYQIGFNKQPISTAADPLMAFLIFAGVSSVIIGVMIGTGGTTAS